MASSIDTDGSGVRDEGKNVSQLCHSKKGQVMRILLIRPCCIGDVVLATAALSALRDAYPDAHITWAVGGWSRRAVEYHPAIDAIVDTGNAAMPVKSWTGFWRFVSQMRSGHYDMVISLVRSPLMSLAVLLSAIETRVGIDSNGRGFGYTLKYKIDPDDAIHEAQIYLNTVGELNIKIAGYQANLPVLDTAKQSLQAKFHSEKAYIVINPAGGSNPGMVLDSKRWLAQNFAIVANALAEEHDAEIVMIAGPHDVPIIDTVQEHLNREATVFAGTLTFPEIGALSAGALLYLGNDTGLTHLAAASGAKTAMVLGISDPLRYAPFTENSIALWKETDIRAGGVASADNSDWHWERDGISAQEALAQLREFVISQARQQ